MVSLLLLLMVTMLFRLAWLCFVVVFCSCVVLLLCVGGCVVVGVVVTCGINVVIVDVVVFVGVVVFEDDVEGDVVGYVVVGCGGVCLSCVVLSLMLLLSVFILIHSCYNIVLLLL